MEYSICADCFNDEEIKNIVLSCKKNGHCDCCGRDNVFVVDDEDISVFISPYCQLFMAYNYDEPEYNSHFGGNLYALLEREKLFIDPEKIKNTPCDCVYDALFATDDVDYMYSEHGCEHAVKDFCYHKEFKEDDVFSKQINLIEKIYNKIKFYVKNEPVKSILYRARIGYAKQEHGIFYPYKDNEIGAAPFKKCPEGRANRSFVSFLYLSVDVETVIHEIRATKGDFVSVGAFRPKRTLNIFNLANPDILKCSRNPSNAVSILQNISFMNYLFSRPTGSSDKYIYLPTQLFVEKLINEDYDGISFRSSFTDELNYVIFDPSLFEFILNSEKLYTIESVETSFDEYKPYGDL